MPGEFVRIIHPSAVIGCQSEAPRHFHDVPVNSLPYPYVSSTIYRLKYCPTKCLSVSDANASTSSKFELPEIIDALSDVTVAFLTNEEGYYISVFSPFQMRAVLKS